MEKQIELKGTFPRPAPIPRARAPRRVEAPDPAPTYFRMLRRGNFNAEQSTPNQYVRENHEIYYYTLQVVWSGEVPLDYKDFILDNAELASFIANMKLMGSGEVMLKAMMEQVNTRLIELGIAPLACKITVRGQGHEDARNDAYLEYTQGRPEHLILMQ